MAKTASVRVSHVVVVSRGLFSSPNSVLHKWEGAYHMQCLNKLFPKKWCQCDSIAWGLAYMWKQSNGWHWECHLAYNGSVALGHVREAQLSLMIVTNIHALWLVSDMPSTHKSKAEFVQIVMVSSQFWLETNLALHSILDHALLALIFVYQYLPMCCPFLWGGDSGLSPGDPYKQGCNFKKLVPSFPLLFCGRCELCDL